MSKRQLRYLHTQHTPIKVCILIKTVFQIRCLNTLQLWGYYICLSAHSDTYTAGGKSIVTSVARRYVLVLLRQNLPSHIPSKDINILFYDFYIGLHCFFGSSVSELDDNTRFTHTHFTCLPLENEFMKKWEVEAKEVLHSLVQQL